MQLIVFSWKTIIFESVRNSINVGWILHWNICIEHFILPSPPKKHYLHCLMLIILFAHSNEMRCVFTHHYDDLKVGSNPTYQPSKWNEIKLQTIVSQIYSIHRSIMEVSLYKWILTTLCCYLMFVMEFTTLYIFLLDSLGSPICI